MRLSIIVPQWKESEADIRPLLTSIDTQIAVDFSDMEVCIVNDCSDVRLSAAFLSSFRNIRPRYITRAVNGGNGMARQTGIESTTGEYIVFADADDVLYSCLSLSVFFDAMSTKPDFFMSAFYEERRENEEPLFVKRVVDAEMLHGKMFRREFLAESGIKFLPQLRLHCDTYFCHVSYHAAKSRPYANKLTYVFRHNDRSLTHERGGIYYVASYPQYAEALVAQLRYYAQHIPTILRVKKVQVREALAKYLAQPAFAAPCNEEHRLQAVKSYKNAIKEIETIN